MSIARLPDYPIGAVQPTLADEGYEFAFSRLMKSPVKTRGARRSHDAHHSTSGGQASALAYPDPVGDHRRERLIHSSKCLAGGWAAAIRPRVRRADSVISQLVFEGSG